MRNKRNPYAMAHSLRGGAGSGAHRDKRRREKYPLPADEDDEPAWADPYAPEWTRACERTGGRSGDTSVINVTEGRAHKPLSREFLLNRGYCCDTGCANCPWKEGDSTVTTIPNSEDSDPASDTPIEVKGPSTCDGE